MDALLAARSAINAGQETRNSRMKGMAAINAGLAARDAVNAVSGMQSELEGQVSNPKFKLATCRRWSSVFTSPPTCT